MHSLILLSFSGGSVELYEAGSKKFETTSSGATVTGALTATTIVKSGGSSSQYLMADGSVSTTVGVSTNSSNIQATWSVTANGSSAYRFTGPGNDAADDNPDLYLVKGQRYRFINNSGGSHPFQIRASVGGSAYSAGVTNNGASSGNIEWNVQHDAPARLYYQCTAHSGMVGNIYITGGGQWQNTSVAASGTPEIYTDYNVGIGTNNPADKLSIYAAPNSLVFGAKDTSRGNHIFQLLADDSAGNGEIRLYQNSGSGTHAKTVEIASSGNSYLTGGNLGIGTANPGHLLDLYNSAGSDCLRLNVNGSAGGSNKQNAIRFSVDGDVKAHVGLAVDAGRLIGGSTANDFCLKGLGSNNILFATNSSERLRITSAGVVKVGGNTLVSPNGNADNFVIDTGDVDSGLQFYLQQLVEYILVMPMTLQQAVLDMCILIIVCDLFNKTNGERLRITSDGQLGLGTNDP